MLSDAPLASSPMFRNCNVTHANRRWNWSLQEEVCIRREAIIQNSKRTRKLSLQAKSFAGLEAQEHAEKGSWQNAFMVFEERAKEGEAARERVLVARLRQFVEDSDVSFYKIASRIGTSGGILSMWLAGTARPRAEELAAIEKFLQAWEICCAFFVSRSALYIDRFRCFQC